jgi:hypothetical protein
LGNEETSKEEANHKENRSGGSSAHRKLLGCGYIEMWPMKVGFRRDEINTQILQKWSLWTTHSCRNRSRVSIVSPFVVWKARSSFAHSSHRRVFGVSFFPDHLPIVRLAAFFHAVVIEADGSLAREVFHLLGFSEVFLTLSLRKPFSFFDPGYKTLPRLCIPSSSFGLFDSRSAKKNAFKTPGWRNWQTR